MQHRNRELYLYDTTLRDGAQTQGIHFSAKDKIQIAQWLDQFGIDFIELGWPGANTIDDQAFEYFSEHPLQHAALVAFGATCKPGEQAENSELLNKLVKSGAQQVTLVAKSSRFHIENILSASVEDCLVSLHDSIHYCVKQGKKVWIDLEHFFDGYADDSALSERIIQCAIDAGAAGIFLCDTNGGCLPEQIRKISSAVVQQFDCPVGIHAHNDCELGVANALAAADAGCSIVQGCINGYGERCGNTNLSSLIPILATKYDVRFAARSHLSQVTELSRKVANRANLNLLNYAPFVGESAFAHKAGLHASAVAKFNTSYEHIAPEVVGNQRRVLVSNQAGKSNLKQKLAQVELHNIDLSDAIELVKQNESLGFQFEEGDASLELLLTRSDPSFFRHFKILEVIENSYVDGKESVRHHVSIKVQVNQETCWSAAEASGPVEALDKALRKSLEPFWPELKECELTDYKVRILDPQSATAATTHVWIESQYRDQSWSTIGCSSSIFLASQQAICDALEYFLLKYVTQPIVAARASQNHPESTSSNTQTGRNSNGYQAA